MLVANNRQSEWIGLQMMIAMTVSQASIKGDARWYPLYQRSGGNKVQVAASKLSEMYLDFKVPQSKCYVTTKIVSRGTFLNTTGLAFSLGIAVAYLVIILNSSLPSPPSSVFGQLTKLILWIMSTLMETALWNCWKGWRSHFLAASWTCSFRCVLCCHANSFHYEGLSFANTTFYLWQKHPFSSILQMFAEGASIGIFSSHTSPSLSFVLCP